MSILSHVGITVLRLLRLLHIFFVVQRDLFTIQLFKSLRCGLYLDVPNGWADMLIAFMQCRRYRNLLYNLFIYVVTYTSADLILSRISSGVKPKLVAMIMTAWLILVHSHHMRLLDWRPNVCIICKYLSWSLGFAYAKFICTH